ncbi:MAG: glycosyltransferase family 4 protein [Verrucomicrobiota bacterium]
MPKFIVAQTGARRGYAVPAILQEADMLETFHTDVCGNAGWGRWLAKCRWLPWVGTRLAKLAARRVPETIRCKTETRAMPNLRWIWRSLVGGKNASESFAMEMRRQLDLGSAAAEAGFGGATHLYSMFGEFPTLLIEAKKKGLSVVTEVYILLSANRLVAEERARFPGWEEEPPDWEGIKAKHLDEDVLFSRTDHYICPSPAVQEDLVKNWGVVPERTSVVPYGMAPGWLKLVSQPECGRILFVGTADLRKGIHYLAMAADELARRGRNYDFRVAGHVSDQVREQPLCRHLHFLGRVPRDKIHEEFQAADIFVLPSLAEGSAEVTYEAMASALPLVATHGAGAVARDGVEGIIVPERDPVALADAIERLVEDRRLRDDMANAARLRAREYTWDKYGSRLVSTLKQVASSHGI